MIYLKLFFEFFKVGLFAIGGGLTTIPFLYELSLKTGWFNSTDLTNMIAISESTPGPIGVNMATYVGNSVSGIIGGIIATIGLVTPSFLIIILVAKFISVYKENKYVKKAMVTIRACSFGLISYAVLTVIINNLINTDLYNQTKNLKDLFDLKVLGIFIVTYAAYKKLKCHPAFMIIVSAILGMILFSI